MPRVFLRRKGFAAFAKRAVDAYAQAVMLVLDKIISDRGSKYAVSGAPCRDADEAATLLAELKRTKKFAKATHNTWGLIGADGPVKNDDGESGAGMIILQMLEREELYEHLVVVTRWYGGKHLGGDRFRHVTEAVRIYLDALKR
ncbi:YigZ family protein [Croceicoccus mobilis]|uniref:Impact N-terminal domain-containing protein n=1 Tax=Croceicoccus mobilis TaxID=1703339 RepID=A0A917DW10_9SPHN|nr:YigZ family protein [Croceicoccus mobilis]GGD72242.1 hypothetical protein GCM10010990_22180 [Croceicoccus mobilis]